MPAQAWGDCRTFSGAGTISPQGLRLVPHAGPARADAEDVTQTVLAKLTEAMRDFRYDPSRSFHAWLKTITRRAWSDLVAHRHRADLERQLEEAFDRELLEVATLRVQQRVAPRTWEAFRLMALEGLPGAEVSLGACSYLSRTSSWPSTGSRRCFKESCTG